MLVVIGIAVLGLGTGHALSTWGGSGFLEKIIQRKAVVGVAGVSSLMGWAEGIDNIQVPVPQILKSWSNSSIPGNVADTN